MSLIFNQQARDRWVGEVSRRIPPGSRVLDVGAGECRYRKLFDHCEYRAQDFGEHEGTSAGPLAQDWEYGDLDYVSDITAIPVPPASFDVVLCTEVLEHVPHPIEALAEITRVLLPGGSAFCTAPLGSGLHQQPHHYYGGFTPHWWRRIAQEVGLEIVSIEPNGRFFRMLSQEVARGAHILRSSGLRGRYSITQMIARLAAREEVSRWLAGLDDQLPVDEFTVGYHVEALKPLAAGGFDAS